jgi:hypothetical protein
MMKIVLFLGLSAAVANAYCPNACSGHGTCGANDVCECYKERDGTHAAWTAADCSSRTCPRGRSWINVADAQSETITTTHPDGHPADIECSDKGVCDGKSGECACFDGYEGIACQRTVCPENCNGHGTCQSLADIAVDDIPESTYSRAWDGDKHFGCVCDSGFRGPDCSLIECPTGDDVMGGEGGAHGRDCSGRGICDYSSGVCECFSGFVGTRCESQTTLV